MAAAHGNSLNAIKLLLSRGASINFQDDQGQTVLHVAAAHSNSTVIEYLIEAGANIETLDIEGISPLFHAAEAKNIAGVQALLSTAPNNHEPPSQALQAAITENNTAATVFILHFQSLSMFKKWSYLRDSASWKNAMVQAVRDDDSDIVLFLMHHDEGIDLEAGMQESIKSGKTHLYELITKHNSCLDSNKALTEACAKGNLKLVKILLRTPNINTTGALAAAALWPDTVRYLLDQGVEPDGQAFLASVYERIEPTVARWMLERGVDVNYVGSVTPQHENPLPNVNAALIAIDLVSSEHLDLFFEYNVDVNLRATPKVRLPLYHALLRENETDHPFGKECTDLLLKHGADVNLVASDPKIYKLMTRLIDQHNIERLELLLDHGVDVNMRSPDDSETLLIAACSTWEFDLNVVKLLLKQGADVTPQIPNSDWFDALHAVAAQGSEEAVNMLLENGANAIAPTGMTRKYAHRYPTALDAACYSQNVKSVQLLLEYGSGIYAQDVLFSAVTPDDLTDNRFYESGKEIIQLLFDHGADLNLPNAIRGHGSALHAYLTTRHIDHDFVRFLVSKGANVHATSERYGTPLYAHAASYEGWDDWPKVGGLELLVEELGADIHITGGPHGTPFRASIRQGDFPSAIYLLKRGSDIHPTLPNCGNALHEITRYGDLEMIEIALTLGADMELEHPETGTPLQIASARGHFPIVQRLIERGANIHANTGSYGTPLQACANPIPVPLSDFDSSPVGGPGAGDNLKVLKYLLEKGADINANYGDHGTALISASHRGEVEIVQHLLKSGADMTLRKADGTTALRAALEPHTRASPYRVRDVMKILVEHGASAGDHSNELKENMDKVLKVSIVEK